MKKEKNCIVGVAIACIVLLSAVSLFMIKSRYDTASNSGFINELPVEGGHVIEYEDNEVMDFSSDTYEWK